MRIHDLGIKPQLPTADSKVASGEKGDDFAQTLMDVLKEVNNSQSNAADMQKAFMTGQPVEYHDLMIAMEKAGTSLQLTLAVRNQLLSAYQEITRMQI